MKNVIQGASFSGGYQLTPGKGVGGSVNSSEAGAGPFHRNTGLFCKCHWVDVLLREGL